MASDDEMVHWVGRLVGCRRDFAALGFHVPGLVLALIEGTRVRTGCERPYDAYLDEVLREYLALPQYWSAASRNVCAVNLRSRYVDFLQDEIEKGTFAGVDKARASGMLDPNLILYHQMPFRDRTLADEWRLKVESQKQDEIAMARKRVGEVTPEPDGISESKLLKLFENTTNSLTFARVERIANGISAIPKQGTSYPLTLEWTDIPLTEKHGNVQLHFVAERSKRKRIAIQNILPGGEFYSLDNTSWYSVALALLSHLELLKLLNRPV